LVVLPELAVGDLNPLEMLFRVLSGARIIFKSIRVPKFGCGPEGLANCGARRRSLSETKGFGVLKTLLADTRHAGPSLGEGGRGFGRG